MWEPSPEIPHPYTLHLLSPVHIGCDEEILPAEYLAEGRELVLCDVESMFQDPGFDAAGFVRFIKENTAPYLGNFSSDAPRRHLLARLRIEVHGGLKAPYPAIKKHARTGGNPYIPGSSIKGAIRSAILYYGLKKQADRDSRLKEAIVACLRKDFRRIKRLSKSPKYTFPLHFVKDENYLEILHRIGMDYYLRDGINLSKRDLDFASLLEVSDTYGDEGVQTAVYGSRVGGTRRQLPAYYEALVPGQKLFFTMKSLGCKFPPSSILKIVYKFSFDVWKRDREWYEQNGLSGAAGFMVRMLETVKEMKQESGAYLIRLGQGSGALSTSMLLLAQDLGIAEEYVNSWGVTGHLTEEPKTRKVLIDGRGNAMPMGWAVLKPYEG
jgi:CRISPR-associated protein Csm5